MQERRRDLGTDSLGDDDMVAGPGRTCPVAESADGLTLSVASKADVSVPYGTKQTGCSDGESGVAGAVGGMGKELGGEMGTW